MRTVPAQDYEPGTPVFYGIQTVWKGSELQTALLQRATANREKAAETEARVATVREKAHELVGQLPSSLRYQAGDARAAATRPLVARERNLRRVAAGLEFIAAHLDASATYVLSQRDLVDLDLVDNGRPTLGLHDDFDDEE